MKRVWTGATFAIALGCAASMSAQAGTTGSQTSSSNRAITVTGCLSGGGSTAGATGTSGVAGAPSSSTRAGSGQFLLTNAHMDSGGSTASGAAGAGGAGSTTPSTPSTGAGSTPGAGSATAGTAGSGSTGSMAMAGSTYILEGRESDLTQHNGHQVEVTGTLAASSSTGSTSGTTGAGSTGAAGAGTTPGSSPGTTPNGSAASGGSSASGSTASAAAQRIQVTSVRMIASSCTP